MITGQFFYSRDRQIVTKHYSNGKSKHIIEYYSDGSFCREQYYDENGKFYREDGPSFISRYENSYLCAVYYENNWYYHNTNIPAKLNYNKNGKIEHCSYHADKFSFQNRISWVNYIKFIT